MNSKTEHIKWLDGLKAVACIGVFLHHFFGSFYPAYHTGNVADTRLYGIDAFLCNTPLGIIINGNFWVCIFLAVSAYVLAIQLMKCSNDNLRSKAGKMMIKRYFRLAIPMVFIGIINYLILFVAKAADSSFIAYRSDMSLVKTIWTYGVSIWMYPDANVLGHTWTMHYLLMAVFVVVLFGIADRKETKYISLIYVILIYPMMMINECYISIMGGLILADITYYERINDIKVLSILNNRVVRTVIGLVFLIAGIYLGGYGTFTGDRSVYNILHPLNEKIPFLSGYLHGISAILILASLFLFKAKADNKGFLNWKILQFLNKYSLAIYLTHGFFILYFCQGVFLLLVPHIINYNLTVLVVFALTVILTFIVSVIFNKTVERLTSFVCSRI